ncbi:MAG: SH3 domain-containing protein [Clostridia bacterium]|nr:SH3 domain-containing protein [Clostridia bacterium]
MKKITLLLLVLFLLCLACAAMAENYALVHNTTSLNIRSGPSASYEWRGSVPGGEWVTVIGESGNWYKIRTVDGKIEGYMSKNYLKTFEGGYAGSSNKAVVNNPVPTHWLNLRVAPSYEAEVLDIFYNGEICTILEKLGDWYYVSAYKGNQQLLGYFRSEYLKVNPTGGEEYYVAPANGGKLNLRTAPGYDAGVYLQIPYGANVSVLLKGNTFWQVMYDGVTGFVDHSFLKKGNAPAGNTGSVTAPSASTAVVQTGNSGKLNLRTQAYANAQIMGQYPNGTTVTILQKGTVWCYVRINQNGQTGYMMTKYLRMNSASQAYKTVHNPNGGTYVNLRSAPDKQTGNVNVRVPVGQQVNVLSWGEEWSQVCYNNINGYMMTWFLR